VIGSSKQMIRLEISSGVHRRSKLHQSTSTVTLTSTPGMLQLEWREALFQMSLMLHSVQTRMTQERYTSRTGTMLSAILLMAS